MLLSSADYLIVAGHHPVFSAGVHGNNDYLESNLRPLLEENNVSIYLSGHDHDSQVNEYRLAVIPLSLVRSVSDAKENRSQDFARPSIFLSLFLPRHARRAMRKRDFSGIALRCDAEKTFRT